MFTVLNKNTETLCWMYSEVIDKDIGMKSRTSSCFYRSSKLILAILIKPFFFAVWWNFHYLEISVLQNRFIGSQKWLNKLLWLNILFVWSVGFMYFILWNERAFSCCNLPPFFPFSVIRISPGDSKN